MSFAHRLLRPCLNFSSKNGYSKTCLTSRTTSLQQRILMQFHSDPRQYQSRNMSIASDVKPSLVSTEIAENGKVATLIMNRPPVNSLSLEMCQAISNAIKELESKPKIQGIVLASSSPSTFSAGLDLTELYQGGKNSNQDVENPPQRLIDFWTSFQQLYLDLYGTRLATVAAIQGHAPAAGCMLALACDYRMMESNSQAKRKIKIGLNEAQFGISAPPFLGQLLLRTIGQVKGEQALALGTLFNPNDALAIGLVDRVVHVDNGGDSEKEDLLNEAKAVAKLWANMPPPARVASKMLARKEFLDDLISSREEDLNHFCNFVLHDGIQAGLGAYLASLKKK